MNVHAVPVRPSNNPAPFGDATASASASAAIASAPPGSILPHRSKAARASANPAVPQANEHSVGRSAIERSVRLGDRQLDPHPIRLQRQRPPRLAHGHCLRSEAKVLGRFGGCGPDLAQIRGETNTRRIR